MERIAILSDVHANLPALRAVLAEVRSEGIGDVAWLGDIVGYGAQPRECVHAVREWGGRCVLGNHDLYTAEIAARGMTGEIEEEARDNPVWAGILHAARQLERGDIEWLRGLRWMDHLPGAVMAHAALHEPEEWPYLLDRGKAAGTLEVMLARGHSLGFFGHTHRQRWFADGRAAAQPEELDGRRLRVPENACCAVVVGSVGQPRDPDGRAGWVVWDPDLRVVEFRRTAYPALEAARAILDAGMPLHSALRLLNEREMLELQSRQRG